MVSVGRQGGGGQDGMDGLPCLLMLAGTLCDHRVFARQRRALRGVARVVVVDYAQLGASGQWADRLLGQLPPRFSVAGFSLGGLWALELLRRAPQRIERIAMIASNAQPASAPGRRKSAWLRKMWQNGGPAEVARHVKPAYFHHEAVRRRHASLVHDMALGTPRRTAFAQFAWAAGRPDGRAALAAFQGPLLLVSGASDRLCPPAWQRAMCAAQPRAQWLELPRVGHFVPLEATAALNNALLRWLGQ
jgi:pimeloyl-ACP methyl ester carboxylesterase